MKSDVEAAARGAIDAINDRALRARAKELLDPFIVSMPAEMGPMT